MAFGRYSYIAAGKEEVNGQESTSIGYFFKYGSGGFSLEKENIESKALTGKLLKGDFAIGTRYWSGKINSIEIDPVSSGILFKSFFGSESIMSAGDKFKHIFTINLNPNQYTSLTFEQYKTEWLRRFLGGRVRGITVKGDLNAIMLMDVDVVATDYVDVNLSEKKNPGFSSVAFRFYETSFLINDVPIPVKSFEISIKENTDPDFNFLGGKKPVGLLRGSMEGSVKFTLNLSETSLEYFTKMLNENTINVKVVMQKSDGHRFSLSLSKVRITNYNENDGDELLKSDIEGVVLSADNESESIVCELTNGRSEEY